MNAKTVIIPIMCILTTFLVGCNEPENAGGNQGNNNYVVQSNKEQPAISTVLEEVPENISNRGVILLGKDNGEFHRADPDPDIPSYPWYERYTADCNLSIESTESELEEFVKNIDETATFSTHNGGGEYGYIKQYERNGYPKYLFYIEQTYKLKGDFSGGYTMYYMEEGMSCGTPVFYDPSGKFLLDCALWESEIPDDILIQFLEPEMIEVKYNPDFLGMGEDKILTETKDIEKVLDIMHTLEVRLEKDDHSELAMAEYQSILSFTDVNGNINDYTIIGAYLIHGDDIYYVENSDKLDELKNCINLIENKVESSNTGIEDEILKETPDFLKERTNVVFAGDFHAVEIPERIRVESTEEEFKKLVETYWEGYDIEYSNNSAGEVVSANAFLRFEDDPNHYYTHCFITRTCAFEGYSGSIDGNWLIYYEDDPGFYEELFYDATGKVAFKSDMKSYTVAKIMGYKMDESTVAYFLNDSSVLPIEFLSENEDGSLVERIDIEDGNDSYNVFLVKVGDNYTKKGSYISFRMKQLGYELTEDTDTKKIYRCENVCISFDLAVGSDGYLRIESIHIYKE